MNTLLRFPGGRDRALTLSYDDADSITPEEEGYFFELTDLALYAKIKE